MLWLIIFTLLLIVFCATLPLRSQLRALDACRRARATVADANRYRPILRLLSELEDDLPSDAAPRKAARAQRRDAIRQHLKLLAEDYGTLLACLRLIMAQSGTDRPDLAKTLARNRILFAVALCRIEFRLQLYRVGIGSPGTLTGDALRLMDRINVLHTRLTFLHESAVWGA